MRHGLGGLARIRSDERLLMICGSTVLVMAGQGVIGPVLPLFARDFGVGVTQVGLTIGAFGLARMLLNVPAGIWADRHGRRFLLVGGPLITAVGMVGSGLAPSIWALLGWRLVAGAGSALYMTGAQIYLIDIAAPAQRGRYLATNQGALLVGVSAGPALGGLVAGWYGLRAPFLVVGAAAVATAVYGWYRLPETRVPEDRVAAEDRLQASGPGSALDPKLESEPVDDLIPPAANADSGSQLPRRFFSSRPFLAVGLFSMAIFSVRGSRQALIPLYASDHFGLETAAIGLVFAAIGVVGLILIAPAGWSTDRFGPKTIIVPAGLIGAIGVVATALAPSIGWFVAALLFTAIGTGISGPAPVAFVAEITPDQHRGSAMGVYRTMGDFGIVLSPPLTGALADVTSIPVALAANGLFLAMATIWFLLAAGPDRRPVTG